MKEVVVASYNIHKCRGSDRKRDPKRIADVIHSLDADVIALQEVDSWPGPAAEPVQMEFLAHTVGLQAISGPTIERQDGHYGNALLTRLPILEVRKLDLTVFRREPRGALDVRLDAGGGILRVIATHLGLLPSERRYQVQRILETVDEEDDGMVTVLLGDINEWFVAARALRWLHARFGEGAGGRTYPSWMPLFKLDRIWVRPCDALANFRVHLTPMTRRASDHLPVSASIKVTADGAHPGNWRSSSARSHLDKEGHGDQGRAVQVRGGTGGIGQQQQGEEDG
jgi:endonuclease/exonuclease/phosphatase family metal-dependent hydrolase